MNATRTPTSDGNLLRVYMCVSWCVVVWELNLLHNSLLRDHELNGHHGDHTLARGTSAYKQMHIP